MAGDSEKLLPPRFLHLDQQGASVSVSDTNPQEDHLTRTTVLCRVGLFGILEGGFLLLSSTALVHPVILHLPFGISLPEAKGGFTILFIVWHALAVAIAKDILLYVFSAEWLAQYERTGRLESRKTDRVSKLTTGLIMQIQHFFSGRATVRYRLAMVLMLLFMSLSGLGPSTAVVTNIPGDEEVDVTLANVTFPYFPNATGDFIASDNAMIIDSRANSILRLELFEKIIFGFYTAENLMIPWPSRSFGASDTGKSIKYTSDVISFDYNCTWHKPTLSMAEVAITSRNRWEDIAGSFKFGFMPLPTRPTTQYISSWIFFRYSRDSSEPPSYFLDLTGLPTTPPSELAPNIQNLTSLGFPDAITMLACDPQFSVYTAQITLSQANLHATNLEGHAFVGNIPSEEMFRNQFLASLIPDLTFFFQDSIDGVTSNSLSSIARLLLFCDEDDPCDTVFKPFPLPTINENMNRFFRSASKAFLDGYNGTRPGFGTIAVPNFKTFQTKGVVQVDEMALVASKPFFIAFTVILTAIAVLLTTLCWVIRQERLMCFNLDNVSQSLIDELEKTGSIIIRSPAMTSPLNASASASSLASRHARGTVV